MDMYIDWFSSDSPFQKHFRSIKSWVQWIKVVSLQGYHKGCQVSSNEGGSSFLFFGFSSHFPIFLVFIIIFGFLPLFHGSWRSVVGFRASALINLFGRLWISVVFMGFQFGFKNPSFHLWLPTYFGKFPTFSRTRCDNEALQGFIATYNNFRPTDFVKISQVLQDPD